METLLPYETMPEEFAELCERAELPEFLLPAAYELCNLNDKELPYHNFDHALHVLRGALDRCDQRDIHGYRRWVVSLGAIGHDALFALSLEDDDFETKEARSAYAAYNTIRKLTAPSSETQMVQRLAIDVSGVIESTFYANQPRNELEEILNEADLDGLTGDPTIVFVNTGKLFVENLLLQGEEIRGDISHMISTHSEAFTNWTSAGQNHLLALVECKLGKLGSLAAAAKRNVFNITLENVLASVRSRSNQTE